MMGINSTICWALLVVTICFQKHASTLANNNDNKKSYIVYLGIHSHGLQPNDFNAKMATQSHINLLESVLGSHEKANECMEYSYNKYINGFVAKLTKDEVENIKKSRNVVSVFENDCFELHTTRSFDFLGLEQNGVTPSNSLWNKTGYGDGVIIGNIDSGVWPESESFNDEGLGPIPSKWKGECMRGSDTTFKCNKKLIGARYFNISQPSSNTSTSPRDYVGHGTHTLSTAGGSFVKDTNVYGLALGVAKGGSPNARVAAYKACSFRYGCQDADVLAAFEAAIGDEVDVLSISLGDESVKDFKEDALAIGSYHAIRYGISVVISAGNSGPEPGNVVNVAPWMFNVGASTLDRTFVNKVYLGNSTLQFKGATLGTHKLWPEGHFHPIIDSASSSKNSSTERLCGLESLDPSKVKGKILVCQISFPKTFLKFIGRFRSAGGVGLILINDALGVDVIEPVDRGLPSSHLHYKDGRALLEYIKNTQNPTAYITNTETEVNIKPAPMIAYFSSRGPAKRYRQILKPDVTAPGVNIIAAVGGSRNLTQTLKYDFESGTSMACPHVAGVVGLLKLMHPKWSPAAIRSAIMTTATTFANDNKPILDYNEEQATPFAYGAGHINPNNAADPGLVYNITENDYLDFLCSIYTESDLKLFTPIPYKCNNSKSILDFNYPSITVNNFSTSATLTRRLTIVGSPATYEVNVIAPSGVNVTVVPSKLKFNRIGEEFVYSVELKRNEEVKETRYVFGSLVWSDGSHNVSSPLVVEKV